VLSDAITDNDMNEEDVNFAAT